MTSQNKLARREDIPETAKWHLDDIFATRADWQKARDAIEGQLAKIQQFAGKLADPQQLLDCLTAVDTMEISLSAVFA